MVMNLKSCRDRVEWDDYVLENGGHPLQLWGWGELKSSHGWKVDRLFLLDASDRVVGAVSLLIRTLNWPFKSLAYVPRGPVVGDVHRQDMLRLLADYVQRTYGSVAVSIEPDAVEYEVSDGWRLAKNQILPSRTILLDLTRTEDELLADMAKKTRQYIRKSSSENFEIRAIKSRGELVKCLDVYHQTSARAGFDLHSDEYYYDVFEKLGEHSPVFAAYQGDQPIAFLWLAISAETAYELYGGMNEQGQVLRANFALKWYAIRKCREWGLSRYDFGGLLDGGIATFKMGWAAGETKLAGTFDRPLSVFYVVWNQGLPLFKKAARLAKQYLSKVKNN
ncbi:aminoacyltransferase [Candidatus Saccharibacteria bacterium]|nr:aminoacyltransferase [Candidatus Saccharibacteria bacterium]